MVVKEKTGVKNVAVLGSTGSIGRQTLDVIRQLPEYLNVVGLAAGSNHSALFSQIQEFRPEYFSYAGYESAGHSLKSFTRPKYLPLEELAAHPAVDIVVIATSSTAALDAVLAAVKAGKTVALANKESLVSAGEIITAAVKKYKARLHPIDSEHSAIWQCLNGEKQPPRRIILTASGGPFLNYFTERMADITPAMALAHPSWKMGQKVTVDSATLMNKGLEIMEARWLFNVPVTDIRALIHPQSILHSMVEFPDGAVKAQLSPPDMRLPIQYALTYPDRLSNDTLPSFDWADFANLTFTQPDIVKFPCLRLAIEAGRKGGTYPVVLCAADEVAVSLFLKERIRFTDIPAIVEKVLSQHDVVSKPSLEAIKAADKWAHDAALDISGASF
ncbi:MAG: 1-deoxy-D-xylulose-5-phosphate reductoisomerase [Dehalococcoidales bacterium]|nr:1-deoxy-D-xylulose-5-phosphate reductoisomerase [Dehalococcoidales bacterium]